MRGGRCRWANLGRKFFYLPLTAVWTWPTDFRRFPTPRVMSRYRHTCITIIPSTGCCPSLFSAIRFPSFSFFFFHKKCNEKMKFHSRFRNSKVVSYGGFLRFTSSTEGGIPLRSTFQYPIVQLQGNDKIVLEYYLPVPANDNHYEVR